MNTDQAQILPTPRRSGLHAPLPSELRHQRARSFPIGNAVASNTSRLAGTLACYIEDQPLSSKATKQIQVVEFPELADDEYFASKFYADVQSKIREADERNLVIDFSNCQWVNPIPLMALLCDLEIWAFNSPNARINFKLGDAVRDKPKRVSLLFMTKLGYLDALSKVGQASRVNDSALPRVEFSYKRNADANPAKYPGSLLRMLKDNIAADYRSLGISLLYPDSEVCPPIVFSAKIHKHLELGSATESAQAFVKQRIVSIDDNYFQGRKSDIRFRDVSLQRIRLAMSELVINSIEHAYEDAYTGPRPVCVFARALDGLSKRPESTLVTTDEANQYIQLFVVDVGRGLISDRGIWLDNLANAIEADKNAIKDGIDFLFQLPVSRRNRIDSGRGSVTGLQNINFVLGHYHEKIALAVHGYWSIFQSGGLNRPKKRTLSNIDAFPRGTYFDLGIRFAPPPELNENWFIPAREKNKTELIRRAVLGPKKSALREWPVFDLGSNPSRMIDDAGFSLSEWLLTVSSAVVPTQIIVKGARDLQKSALLRIIEYWLSALSTSAKPDCKYVLTIADLSSSQALFIRTLLIGTRSEALTRPQISSSPKRDSDVERIPSPLIGNVDAVFRLKPRALMLQLITEQAEASPIDIIIESFINRPGSKPDFTRYTFAESNPRLWNYIDILVDALGALALNDGRTFALWLSKSHGVQEKHVVWERETKNVSDSSSRPSLILPVYINYPIVSQDRDISKLIRKALRRAISLFPELRSSPVDELIRSDYADATLRLTHLRDEESSKKKPDLNIISCLVTQQTIRNQQRKLRKAGATLACFIVPSYSIQLNRYVTSEEIGGEIFSLFDIEMDSDFAAITKPFEIGKQYWERIPTTAYIRPFVAEYSDGRGRAIVGRSGDYWGGARTRAQSYEEWSSSRVMKLGHWGVDHRHGLIELNYDVCLGRQAEEYSGFYSWLVDMVLTTLTAQRNSIDGDRRLLVVYPVSRRNGMIIRHLKKMSGLQSHLDAIHFLPLSFLPDIGDGLKLLTPLTLAQIRDSRATCLSRPVFLDIGFVGNRTFRHTSRQVLELGYKSVQGIGLLNRTSYPGLNSEASLPVKEDGLLCYWRLEVPTLDGARSCPICRSLSDLRTLSLYVGSDRTVLSTRLRQIANDWEMRKTSVSWQDHGITPAILISHSDSKVNLELEDFHSQWKIRIENSAQAAAFAVETARVTAEQDFPLRYAEAFIRSDQPRVALEVLLAYLVLCGHDLSNYYKEQVSRKIIRLVFLLLQKKPDEQCSSDAPLRGLAVIAICGLDADTKTSLHEAFLAHTATRTLRTADLLLLGYVLRMSDEEGYSQIVDRLLREPLKSSNVRINDALLWNAKSPANRHLQRARSFFGAGDDHGALKDWLDAIVTAEEAKHLCELTMTYVWRDVREFTPVFDTLFAENSSTLRRVRELASTDAADKNQFPLQNDYTSDVVEAISAVRREFQNCYLRIDNGSVSFENLIPLIRSTIMQIKGISPASIKFDRLSFLRKDQRASISRYVLIGHQVRESIVSIARSAKRKGRIDLNGHFIRVRLADGNEHPSSTETQDSVVLEFSNLPSKEADPTAFLAMRPLMTVYYQITDLMEGDVQSVVRRYISATGDYVVSISLKLYQGGD
jgi:hypothetical protein